MSSSQETREEIIQGAESAFFDLVHEIDFILDCTAFWLQRYSVSGEQTKSVAFKRLELEKTLNNITILSNDLSNIVVAWKEGETTLLSKAAVEIYVLNEIWANLQALVYFLASHEIDLEQFNARKSMTALKFLIMANRSL